MSLVRFPESANSFRGSDLRRTNESTLLATLQKTDAAAFSTQQGPLLLLTPAINSHHFYYKSINK